jgi:hypothetical protein
LPSLDDAGAEADISGREVSGRGEFTMSEMDPTAAAHRRAVELEDWDRVRELEDELIEATDNTERPEDGPQPTQDPDGELDEVGPIEQPGDAGSTADGSRSTQNPGGELP